MAVLYSNCYSCGSIVAVNSSVALFGVVEMLGSFGNSEFPSCQTDGFIAFHLWLLRV